MSYHKYREMMGEDLSRIAGVPRYDFNSSDSGWDVDRSRFDGYGSLYHDGSGRGIRIDWYLWDGGEGEDAIREHLTRRGFAVSHLTSVWGGNGHYSMFEPQQAAAAGSVLIKALEEP